MQEKFSLTCIFIVLIAITACVESEITVSQLPETSNGTISGQAINVFTNEPLTNTWLCLKNGTYNVKFIF